MDKGASRLKTVFVCTWVFLGTFIVYMIFRYWLWNPSRFIVSPIQTRLTSKITQMKEPARGSTEALIINAGHRAFLQHGCGVCHGPNAEGGVKNHNAYPEGFIPHLRGIEESYDLEDLADKISQGVDEIEKTNEKGDVPPLFMPSYGNSVTQEEIKALAAYLYNLPELEEDKE